MKTHTQTSIAIVVAALTLGAFNPHIAKADAMNEVGGLIYNDRSIIHAINGDPNAVADRLIDDARILFVDKANGPAIYSYAGKVNHQNAAFKVHYVDTAHGPAIYSYPNNNAKHRLKLADNENGMDSAAVTAVSAGMSLLSIR